VVKRITANQQRVRGVHDREEREAQVIRELNRKAADKTQAAKNAKPVIVI